MTTITLPTTSDAQTIAFDMVQKLPDNVLDLWTRFLTGLRHAVTDPALHTRLDAMLSTFQQLRRLPIPAAHLATHMTQAEVERLAQQPFPLMIENHLRFRGLLYEIETVMNNHPEGKPLHWFLAIQRERATQLMTQDPTDTW